MSRRRVSRSFSSWTGSTRYSASPGAAHRLAQRVAERTSAAKPFKVDNGRLLTEDEFDVVKDLRSEIVPKTSMQILAELPDDGVMW